jgi:hypothetical protein
MLRLELQLNPMPGLDWGASSCSGDRCDWMPAAAACAAAAGVSAVLALAPLQGDAPEVGSLQVMHYGAAAGIRAEEQCR